MLEATAPREKDVWNAFLAVPMSSIPKRDYEKTKRHLRQLIVALSPHPSWSKIFCPPLDLETTNFDSPADALVADVRALERSERFVAILPAAAPTSVYFEAGIAYQLNKPMFVAYATESAVPFLLRGLPDVRTNVKLFQYRTIEEIGMRLLAE